MNERKMQIESFAKEFGLSFASAKAMLEEIEADDFDYCDSMREVWYWWKGTSLKPLSVDGMKFA